MVANHRDSDPRLLALLGRQRWVVSRRQLTLLGWPLEAVEWRLGTKQWNKVIGDVLVTRPGPLSRDQWRVAALIHAGDGAALDAGEACWVWGLRSARTMATRVEVAVPPGATARSRGVVRVRQCAAAPPVVLHQGWPLVDPATAAVVHARSLSSPRDRLALLSEVLQRRLSDHAGLLAANDAGPPRGRPAIAELLCWLASGAHSLGEVDLLRLVARSPVLAQPECNSLLRLPSGLLVSPDALWRRARLVHETNGRVAHEREDLLERTHERSGDLEEAGFTVVASTPRQLRQSSDRVVRRLETIFRRQDGLGLPPGVVVLRTGPPTALSNDHHQYPAS